MRSARKKISVIMVIILASFLLMATQTSAQSAPEVLREYFDHLMSGNFESASQFWRPDSKERAMRFNIQYDDIPIKADCSSPIIRNLDVMKNHLTRAVKQSTRLKDNIHYKLEYGAVVGNQKVSHDYYLGHDSTYYWLIYPQDYFCKDWEIRETEYFRIHMQKGRESYLNEINLFEIDNFVERICKSLGIKGDDLKYIADNKIEYFYCGNDRKVETITGFLIKGTYDLPSNDIISSFFPHNHEIIHLLVNYKLRQLPLYTLPLFREGIAVYYAGRTGKTPYTLLELGGYILHHEIVELDSILTMGDFERNSSSDIAYPISGLFTSYMIDKIGTDNYFDLYLYFSGPFNQVNGLVTSKIQQRIAESLKKETWTEVLVDFKEYYEYKLKEKAEILPGKLEKGKILYENDIFTIKSDKEWLGFECRSQNDIDVEGNILFSSSEKLMRRKSTLFETQYKREFYFEGYRYGLRYDQNEVGVYDYATDHLIAKYIWGISPSSEYFDEPNKTISVKFKKSLLNHNLTTDDNFKLLPR